jgi:hypothetical protein
MNNRNLKQYFYLPCEIWIGGYNPESAYENEFNVSTGLLINGSAADKSEYFHDLGFVKGGVTPNYQSEKEEEKDIMQILGTADVTILDETVSLSGSIINYNFESLQRFAPTAKLLKDGSGNVTGLSLGNADIKSLKEDYSLPLILHPIKYTYDSGKKNYWPNSISESTGAVNKNVGYPAADYSSTGIAVDGFVSAPVVGKTFMFVNNATNKIAHSTIYKVASGSTNVLLKFTPALTNEIDDNFKILPLAINYADLTTNATGYAIGAGVSGSPITLTTSEVLLEGTIVKIGDVFYIVDSGCDATNLYVKGGLTVAIPASATSVVNQDLSRVEFDLTITDSSTEKTLDTINASGNVLENKHYKVFYNGYKIYFNNVDVTNNFAQYYRFYSAKTSFANKDFTVNHQNGKVYFITNDISKAIDFRFKYITNDRDVIAYQSIPSHQFEIPHEKKTRIAIPFEFNMIKDETREDGDQLIRFGYGINS